MNFEFVKKQKLNPAIQGEIEAFLDRQNSSHPFQFPNWTTSENSGRGGNKYCAILREQGEIRWFAHCGVTFPAGEWMRPIRSLTINRGPACDHADLTLYGLRKLVEKSKELGFAYIKISPDWVERPEWSVGIALPQDGWQPLPGRSFSLRLSLNAENDQLLRSFRHDTKLHIRRSEQQGVVIRLAQDDADIREFQRIYFEMARKKNIPVNEPDDLSHALRWVMNQKDRGALLIASKNATPLGGVLVVRAAKRSWGIFSANVRDPNVTAGHLLQWSAIQWAKEHGCVDYDLGGYREGINTGPPSFKRGFCRAVVEFSPAYRHPLNRSLCSILDLAGQARTKWRAMSQVRCVS
jgi:Acetyltransferase (GNAT) domain